MKNCVVSEEKSVAEVKEQLPEGITKNSDSGLKDSPMANQLQKLQKKKPADADFSSLKVNVLISNEEVDMEALRQEAKQRSEQLFGSANDYYRLRQRIDELAAIDKIELTRFATELSKLMAEKDRFDSQLANQPSGVQDQFKVDLFIIGIEKLTPRDDSSIISLFTRIEEMGRGRTLPAEEIAKIPREERLYFIADNGDEYNLGHIPSKMPGREGQISGADRRIFKSTRQAIWRYSEFRMKKEEEMRQAEIAKCDKIRQETGEDPRNFLRKIPGAYIFYLPGKTINGKAVGMPGAAKVEIYTFVKDEETKTGLRIIEGAGCLRPRWEAHEKFKHNFPFWWLEYYIGHRQQKNEAGKASEFPDSIPDELRDPIHSYIRRLFMAWIQTKKSAWKSAKILVSDAESAEPASAQAQESESATTGA